MLRYRSLALAAILLLPSVVQAQTFKGYDCTQDCSGHEAGYDWAQQKGVTDESDCGGNSNSFIEGCKAYAEENDQTIYGSSEDSESDGQSSDDEQAEE